MLACETGQPAGHLDAWSSDFDMLQPKKIDLDKPRLGLLSPAIEVRNGPQVQLRDPLFHPFTCSGVCCAVCFPFPQLCRIEGLEEFFPADVGYQSLSPIEGTC